MLYTILWWYLVSMSMLKYNTIQYSFIKAIYLSMSKCFTDYSYLGLFIPWTIRTLDDSYDGLFVPFVNYSHNINCWCEGGVGVSPGCLVTCMRYCCCDLFSVCRYFIGWPLGWITHGYLVDYLVVDKVLRWNVKYVLATYSCCALRCWHPEQIVWSGRYLSLVSGC